MKKWIAVAAVLFVAAGIFFGSPYLAVRNLKQAAISGDADQLDAAVDFPSVRESLKAQMSAALIKKLSDDPKMRGNPFAGMGMLMMPAIVDRMVNAYVTSDGIAALVRGNKPSEGKPDATENPNVSFDSHWVSTDRFRMASSNKTTGEKGPSLLFERRGFASWKLIKLELPETMFKGP